MTTARIMGALAAAAAALGLANAAYQAAGEAEDRRKLPPPGRLVDVGGCPLHIMCAGQGGPAVVIIPALGASSEAWADVQRAVAQETTVCSYDRAGLGWSDSRPDTAPRREWQKNSTRCCTALASRRRTYWPGILWAAWWRVSSSTCTRARWPGWP